MDIPHGAADNAANTGAGEGQTDQSFIGVDGALQSQSHCGADVSSVGQVPSHGAAGSNVCEVSDLQGNADDHSSVNISHDQTNHERSDQRSAQAVPADGVADDGSDCAQINKQSNQNHLNGVHTIFLL